MKKIEIDLYNVILKPIFILALVGIIFLFNVKKVYGVEIVVQPETASTNVDVVANPDVTIPSITIPTTTYMEGAEGHMLAIALPEKYDIGIPEYSIEKMCGYEVNVYIYDNLIYSTENKFRDAGTGFIDLEDILRQFALDNRGDCENIVFKVKYIGKNNAGEYVKAKDPSGNELEWSSGPKSIYKVSVSGRDAGESVSTYGFLGQNVVLVPNLQDGYSFKQWTDGNQNNPRMERISANISENKYTFETVKSVEPEYDSEGLYDSVPVTGESNWGFILIMACVFGFMGAIYSLFVINMSANKY